MQKENLLKWAGLTENNECPINLKILVGCTSTEITSDEINSAFAINNSMKMTAVRYIHSLDREKINQYLE